MKYILFLFLPLLVYPKETAVVLKVKGESLLKREKEVQTLKKGIILKIGDRIEVKKKGLVIIKFLDKKSIVRIKENTVMEIKQGGKDKKVAIFIGEIMSTIKVEKFTLETPTSLAAVKGTEFSTSFISDTTKIIVNEGEVNLSNGNGSIIVKKGEIGISVSGKSPEKRKLLKELNIDFKTPGGKIKTLHLKIK